MDEWIVKVIHVMYEGVKTSVRIYGWVSEEIKVDGGGGSPGFGSQPTVVYHCDGSIVT